MLAAARQSCSVVVVSCVGTDETMGFAAFDDDKLALPEILALEIGNWCRSAATTSPACLERRERNNAHKSLMTRPFC